MQVVLDEVMDAYNPRIVIELQSETVQDQKENLARTLAWIEAWMANRDGDGDGSDASTVVESDGTDVDSDIVEASDDYSDAEMTNASDSDFSDS
jgi:adenylate kinase